MEHPVNLLKAKQATDRIRSLAATLDNRDDYIAGLAIANLAGDRQAFWSTARYHNAPACILLSVINQHASIADAATELRGFNPGRDWLATEYLDTLLPLNEAAVVALSFAYAAAGTFRDPGELRRRTARFEARREAA